MLKAFLIAFLALAASLSEARDYGKDGRVIPPTDPNCVSQPSKISTHPGIKLRVQYMGGYESFIGSWRGTLKKGLVSVPVKIQIFNMPNRFLLRMTWKSLFSTNTQDHSFEVCTIPGLGSNGLLLHMHNSPFGPKTPYGLAGLTTFKIVGDTTRGLYLDLSPDELGPQYKKTNLVISGIRKIR